MRKPDVLKQWTRNLANLKTANQQVPVFIKMQAVYAPYPVELVPIDEIDAKLSQYKIVFREVKDANNNGSH